MELLKHTPGPWHVDKAADGMPIIRSEFGGQVCMFNRNIIQTKHQVEANAHLIAAAPDLMEALLIYAGRHERSSYVGHVEMQDIAHAAIVKATGGTS